MLQPVETLCSSLIDYAGLFPPAKLDMAPAVTNYAKYLAGPDAWALCRFVVPVSRLAEFERSAAPLFSAPGSPGAPAEPWLISALVGDNADKDIDEVFAFNQRNAPEDPGEHEPSSVTSAGAVIDTIELKVGAPRDVDRLMEIVPEQLDAFFEFPIAADPRGFIAALAGTGGRAKVRTGGLTPDAFPAARDLARFINACRGADVAFKATAGLHHPVAGDFPLTYEPACPSGAMFGFLNVFLAAALLRTGEGSESDAAELLQERDASQIKFSDQGVAWRHVRLSTGKLALVRENFAISFGSCSFEEPMNELRALKLLG